AVGGARRPASLGMTAPLVLQGGVGEESGGAGGPLAIEATRGDVRLAGVVDFGGGASGGRPGHAGALTATLAAKAKDLIIAGRIVGDGGEVQAIGDGDGDGGGGGEDLATGDGDGGDGGRITMAILSRDGDLSVETTGTLEVDGGAALGAGRAGAGGRI